MQLICVLFSFYTVKGSRKQFITVCHDVWDGKRKTINGLTIIIVDPDTLEVFRVPIALTQPLGKKALELKATCMLGLERAGIKFEDLYAACNDNCTTAVKTGRL